MRILLRSVLQAAAHHHGARRQYQLYFNEIRPHQGIGQRVPTKPVLDIDLSKPIEVTSVLGGLHVDYRRAA